MRSTEQVEGIMNSASHDVIVTGQSMAIRLLLADGSDLATPCSRYGRTISECAETIYIASLIFAITTGEPLTVTALDSMAGLVVNDHPDPEYLIRNYAKNCGLSFE